MKKSKFLSLEKNENESYTIFFKLNGNKISKVVSKDFLENDFKVSKDHPLYEILTYSKKVYSSSKSQGGNNG